MEKNIAVKDIIDIVNWFLYKQPMTHKKLQKMLYFSYGIYLFKRNTNVDNLNNFLFTNKFQAWVHGPVDPYVYQIYKNSGIKLISIEDYNDNKLDKKVTEILEEVMDKYSNFSADELEEMTHNQIPWKNARKELASWEPSSNPILDKDIYYAFLEF